MRKLELPKTKLTFEGGVLTKRGSGDSVIGSFAAKDILKVYLKDTKEYGPASVICISFIALAGMSKTFISDTGWSWTATITCLVISALTLLMINGKKIVIETSKGEVGYIVADPFEEAEGYVLSLSHAFVNTENRTTSTEKDAI